MMSSLRVLRFSIAAIVLMLAFGARALAIPYAISIQNEMKQTIHVTRRGEDCASLFRGVTLKPGAVWHGTIVTVWADRDPQGNDCSDPHRASIVRMEVFTDVNGPRSNPRADIELIKQTLKGWGGIAGESGNIRVIIDANLAIHIIIKDKW